MVGKNLILGRGLSPHKIYGFCGDPETLKTNWLAGESIVGKNLILGRGALTLPLPEGEGIVRGFLPEGEGKQLEGFFQRERELRVALTLPLPEGGG